MQFHEKILENKFNYVVYEVKKNCLDKNLKLIDVNGAIPKFKI